MCLGRRPKPDGVKTSGGPSQEVCELAPKPSKQPPRTHTFGVAGASLIIPSFPFLIVSCASSLHIILVPPLLPDASFLLLSSYFFSAAQPHNPESCIYRRIFAVLWQIQHK